MRAGRRGDELVAGVDVGNSTTEIVLARRVGSGLEVVWNGTANTVGRKGSNASLEGAAALLARAEAEAGVRVDLVALAELRAVDTSAVALASPPARHVVRNLVRAGAATPAGRGFAVGVVRPLAELAAPWPGRAPAADVPAADVPAADVPAADVPAVVVAVGAGWDFDDAARAVRDARASGHDVVGVLVAADEGVLISHRLDADIPVVDDVDLDGLTGGETVAVEVTAAGAVLRHLLDPLVVATALGIESAEYAALAEDLRELGSAPAVALIRDGSAAPAPARPGWFEVDSVRHPLDPAGRALAAYPPGVVTRLELDALAATAGGLAVRDVWLRHLDVVDDGSWLRRAAVDLTHAVVALLSDDPGVEAAPVLAALTGRPAVVVALEHDAAAVGGRSTPGCPHGALVCDVGGGTVDCIGRHGAVVAAGGGEIVTRAIGAALDIPPALAERVKRTSAIRVDGPHLAAEEDGRRTFLSPPASAEVIGRLCIRTDVGLVAFTDRLAGAEWRSLRLALKRATIGASVIRALAAVPGGIGGDGDGRAGRSADGVSRSRTVVLAGGAALDDELVQSVAESLRSTGIVVARANTGGRFGPRFAVAWGLAELGLQYLKEETS